jgi:hypothetical protein
MLQELPQVEDEAVAYTLSLKVEPRCVYYFSILFFKFIDSLILRVDACAERRDTTEAIETLLMEEAKLKQQVQQLQVRIADLEMENRRCRTHNRTHNRTRTVWGEALIEWMGRDAG